MTTLLQSIEQIFSHQHTHHGYLIEGDSNIILPELCRLIESTFSVSSVGNPDFQIFHFETMTINDARQLTEAHLNKSFTLNGNKFFIISLITITAEAEHALLKTLEEPPPGTHFFLLLSSRWILLPTVRSRLELVVVPSVSKNSYQSYEVTSRINPHSFLIAPISLRLTLFTPIIEEKDARAAMIIVDELIHYIYQLKDNTFDRETALSELLHVRQYLTDRSASIKLLLEHLALVLPVLI